MAGPDLDNLSALLDDAKCFAVVRQHRWPDGVRCPACASSAVIRDGCDETQRSRQRYWCKTCSGRFDDLTGTVLAGHHQPLRVWVLCLYFMGLKLDFACVGPGVERQLSDSAGGTQPERPFAMSGRRRAERKNPSPAMPVTESSPQAAESPRKSGVCCRSWAGMGRAKSS
jgi:Transposase zinc-ribbon domain